MPPLILRTALPWAPTSYIWIYPPTFPARMLAGAFRYNAASPVPTPTTMPTCRSICQRGWRNTYSTNCPRKLPLKTTFRLLFNDTKRRKSVDTNRFAVAVGSSRWCRRRTGWISLDRPASEKWTSSFFVTRHCATRPAPANEHRQNGNLYRRMPFGAAQRESLGATVSDSWCPVTAAFLAQNGLAAAAPRCFPTEPTFGTRATTVCGGLVRSK